MWATADIISLMSRPSTQLAPAEAIAESIPVGFVNLAPNLRVSYINTHAMLILGMSKDLPVEGGFLWEKYPPEVAGVGEQTCRLVMKSQKPMTFEVYHADNDRWYGVTVAPAGGGLVLYYVDITDNKEHDKTESLLRAERQIMYEVFMQAPAAIAMLRGPDHVFRLANDPYIYL